MVILKTQSEYGHAPPPQTPYSIVTNLPGWDVVRRIRDEDLTALAGIVHIYPRFSPTQFAGELGREIAKKLGHGDKGVLMYLNPEVWEYTRRHCTLPHRMQHVMKPEDLAFGVVDVAGHRLYAILYNPAQMLGIMLTWGNCGLGLSIRGAEQLLADVASMTKVQVMPGSGSGLDPSRMPEPTWTPEGAAHGQIRSRIAELLQRAPVADADPASAKVGARDVFLYPTGMAAIFYASNLMMRYRPGTIVVLGVVFHNTYHHLIEECPHGWKHFGKVDKPGINELEAWLREEDAAKRPVSYLFVEFPGNPTLDTPDLGHLKKLSDTYGFVLIVDETISSFANVDVTPVCDMILTSLTKAFSGQSNVMAGSVVLNPLSPHYPNLSPLLTSAHHNEFFVRDAEVLLANSTDFLARSAILNRNAAALVSFLQKYQSSNPNSVVVNIQYPSVKTENKANYDARLRRPSPELPKPGYGCLMTIEFASLAAAQAFYHRCGFYPSPHLGGHVTIMFCYNMMVFGKKPEESAYMRSLGVKEEAVRISVGLEDAQDIIDTVQDGLSAAAETVGKN